MTKKYFLFFIAFGVSCFVYAQDEQRKSIAELQRILKNSNKNIDRCNTMLDLALEYILKPGEYPQDMDSAGLLTRQAEAMNMESLNSKAVEAKIYFTRANLFREQGDPAKGKIYCEKSIGSYKKLPLSNALGEAYFELANYYDWSNAKEIILKKEALSNALTAFKATGNKIKQGFALKNLADLDIIMRNYGLALVELQQALDIYNSINYPQLQGVYDLLNLVYNHLGDFPSAVKYGLLAVKTCEAVKDTSLQLCTIYYRLGISYDYWSRNHSPEALVYLQKAFDIAIKYNDAKSILLTVTSLSDKLTIVEKKQEAVSLLQKYKDRIKMEDREDSIFGYSHFLLTYKQAGEKLMAKNAAAIVVSLLPVSAGPPDQSIQFGYSTLVGYFISQHQPELAEKYANFNLANSAGDPQSKAPYLLAYRFKAQADSSAGDFASAFKNHQIYSNLKDSLFNEKKSFQFTQMQVAFETEKKDNDLKILQAENALKNGEIQKSRQVRNGIIIAAILLVALFYTGYLFKQRSNARLQKKQEEINLQNDILKSTLEDKNQLLTEKEWLVKEIHHRVKNNLQMIISLLNAQSEFLDHPSALNAIKESRERMQAVALIHQKLYQPDQGTFINMPAYIQEMVDYIGSGFTDTERINFKLDIEDIKLDVSQAVPLGLILNEAITNAVKYAFPSHGHGTVNIFLHYMDTENIVLQIKDNGQGLPANFNFADSNSLGMQLMQLFAEQLEGKLKFKSVEGVEMSLTFKQFYTENKNTSLINVA
jgi:two-component system, sensor histidine kinase PdtaS